MPERKPRLEGKAAIVTGAGSRGPGVGNGKAAAILFAREGARVLLVDMYAERAQETLEVVQSEGGVASVFAGDVTSLDDCRAMVKAAVDRYGRLDILHNNVGIDSPEATAVDMDLDEWDRLFKVNVKSIVLTGRAAIPQMKSTGGGVILTVSSIAALRPRPGHDMYSASKAGVIGITQAMAMSHALDGIRVNCIVPGPVQTPMVADGMTEAIRTGQRLSVALQTEGTGWDVGWAAVYLASDEARWVTGMALLVDGGAHLTRRTW